MPRGISEKIKGLDSFHEGFHMRLDNGKNYYGSFFGACLSVLTVVILMGFAYTKMETLVGRDDVSIIESFQDNYFSDRDMFSA